MARNRTIKPEFFTSDQVVDCSTTARLLFVGLWCFSDDRGVHPASARRAKMEVFPADNHITTEDVARMVEELKAAGLLGEFVGDDSKTYWYSTGWKKHQRIEKPNYKHPEPPEENDDSPTSRRTVDDQSTTSRHGIVSDRIVSDINPPLTPDGGNAGWGEVISDLRANQVLTADSVVADLRQRRRPLPWVKAMVDRYQNFAQPQGWTPGMLVKLLQDSTAEPEVCLPVRATVVAPDPVAEEAARQRERDKLRPERLKRFGAILDGMASEERLRLLADQPASIQSMAKASEPQWKTCRLTSDLMLEALQRKSSPPTVTGSG